MQQKKEKELTQSLKALLENINSPVNHYTRDTLKALGNKFMNCRSISIQEAIMRCLPHLAMSNFSLQVIYIPSDMPEYRHGKLKSKKDLENLPDDSIDIFEKGIIDKYSNRPFSLHSLCYAEFAANYGPIPKHRKVIDSDPQKVIQLRHELGNMMLRKFPKTIRTYTPSESKDPERFYYSKFCLYFAWVDEPEILGIYSTYKESFYHNERIIKENIRNFEKFSDAYIDSIMDKIQHEITNEQNERVNLRDDPSMLINKPSREITDNTNNIRLSYKEPVIDNIEFNRMVESLNEEQRSVYRIVEQHCENLEGGKETKQLLHFISGPGGVGKSYLIKCIRLMINRKYDDSDINTTVIVTASTGAAAANIDGLTIHQVLQLDCQQSGYLNSKPLSEKKKQGLRALFAFVQYIIIDEISMIGYKTLLNINARLNSIFCTPLEVFFGGISILFVGELYQLPPVMQTMVFEARGISSLGHQLWKDLVTFSELTTIVRTKFDPTFTEICHRARVGLHTEQDTELLRTRIISNEVDVKHFMNEILIVYTNKECMEHNKRCTQYLNKQQRIIKVRAAD